MKKALALLLTMALLISGVSVLPTMAAEAVEITLPTVSGNPGDTVDVPIKVDTKATGGIIAITLEIGYDADQMELVVLSTNKFQDIVAQNGDMFPDAALTTSQKATDNPYILIYEDALSENKSGSFTLATLKFKIKDTAVYKEGGYAINVTVADESIYNDEEDDVPFTVTSGKVNVNCLHTGTEWKTTTPATCESKGSENEVCKVCGKVMNTREIPATGHNYGTLIAKVEPTCERTGKKAYYQCSACQTLFDENKVKTTEAALIIQANGHSYGTLIAQVDPTCEGTGKRAHYECSVCRKLFDESKTETTADALIIGATGHSYGEWTQTIAPTCEGKGEEKHTCQRTNCTAYETREVAALGHSYGEWVETKAATYAEKGEEERKCTVCQKVETRETAVLVKEITGDKTDGLEAVVKPVGDTKLSADISFIVKNVTDTISAEDKAMILEAISSKKAANAALAAVLNLQMTKNGVVYQPNGKLLVTVEVPQNVLNDYTDVKLMHVKADGSGEVVEYALNGTKATFEADGLDYYTFVGVAKTTGGSTAGGEDGNKSPLSGDSGMPALVTAVSLSALLGAALLLNKKRSAAK